MLLLNVDIDADADFHTGFFVSVFIAAITGHGRQGEHTDLCQYEQEALACNTFYHIHARHSQVEFNPRHMRWNMVYHPVHGTKVQVADPYC